MLDSLEQAAYDFLGGKVLDGHFRLVSRASASNEDVILEPSVREALQRHVIDYRQHMEAIKAAGEDPSRGILMAGPPGCGKTSANRLVLSSLPDHRGGREFDLLQHDGLRTIWNLVKRTNGLLILENLDAVGGVSPRSPTIRFSANARTARWPRRRRMRSGHCDDQPPRVDAALTARLAAIASSTSAATAEARRVAPSFPNRLSPGCSLNLDKAVAKTEGFTGAYVAELASQRSSKRSTTGRHDHGQPPQRRPR